MEPIWNNGTLGFFEKHHPIKEHKYKSKKDE